MEFQGLHLAGGEGAPLPFTEPLEAKRSVLDPSEAEDPMPHRLAEPPYLPVAPFGECEAKPVPRPPEAPNLPRTRRPIVQNDAVTEAGERVE